MKRSTKGHWDKHWQQEGEKFEKGFVPDDFRKSVDVLTARGDIRGKKVLEVGAGSGMDSICLAMWGACTYVLDYSDEALHITGILAKNLNTYPQRVKADAKALPFANESFDMVFHVGLLEHFVAPAELLREQRRILKPKGYLLVDVPQRYTLYTIKKQVLMKLDRWFAGWETEYTISELEALIRKEGFQIVTSYGRGFAHLYGGRITLNLAKRIIT